MSIQEGKYNIKAVSKLLGIQSGTLRAWERRYHVIAPKRNEAGHRLYTEEHINILKWLIKKVDNGFTISQAVNLLENNEIIVGKHEIHKNKDIDQSLQLMDKLIKSLLAFDEYDSNERLNEAFSLYSVEKVVIEIIGTILMKVKEQRDSGKITSAQEHFLYSFFRSRLGYIFHSIPVNRLLPKAIAVCGPNDSSELELLIFSIFLRRNSFDVLYIGASIANHEFDHILNQVKPAFLFLSCTLGENVKKTFDLVDHLTLKYQNVKIGLYGAGFSQVLSSMYSPYEDYLVGETKQQWQRWMKDKLVH